MLRQWGIKISVITFIWVQYSFDKTQCFCSAKNNLCILRYNTSRQHQSECCLFCLQLETFKGQRQPTQFYKLISEVGKKYNCITRVCFSAILWQQDRTSQETNTKQPLTVKQLSSDPIFDIPGRFYSALLLLNICVYSFPAFIHYSTKMLPCIYKIPPTKKQNRECLLGNINVFPPAIYGICFIWWHSSFQDIASTTLILGLND